jgi:hypothetical protein
MACRWLRLARMKHLPATDDRSSPAQRELPIRSANDRGIKHDCRLLNYLHCADLLDRLRRRSPVCMATWTAAYVPARM